MVVEVGDYGHTDQQWEEEERFVAGTESSEDETQRLFETLGDAATISIKIGRIAGATINEGPASTMVPSRAVPTNFVKEK
jgi:hypothetical protein